MERFSQLRSPCRGPRAWPLLAGAALLPGCASPAPPPEPAPREEPGVVLAYAAPEQALRYVLADTVTITFQGGALSNVRIEGGYRSDVEVRYEDEDGGMRVTARVLDFFGELRNPMAGTTRASEADIPEEWVLRVSPTGEADVLVQPAVSCAFEQIVGSENLLRNFFIRLPEEPVRQGEAHAWTDTLRIDSPLRCGATTGHQTITAAVTSAWLADSMVDGRRLHVIRTTRETTIRSESTSDASETVQALSGTTMATSLFDPARGILVSSEERGLLSGMLDVRDAGIQEVPLNARVRRHLVLDGG